MREWCLVANYQHSPIRMGTIVNMSLTTRPHGPVMNEFQRDKGYVWVPIEAVSDKMLNDYRFYHERP